VDVKTHVDRYDINIKIWGNFWADIASAFEVFFVGTVAGEIEDAITAGLTTTLPTVVNGFINKSEMLLHIPKVPNWYLDLATESKYLITETFFGFDAKALFFDKRTGEIEPTAAIPDLPMKMIDHVEKFQAFVSTYALDSFTSSWLSVGKLGGTIKHDMIPATSPVQLNTSDTTMKLVFGGIEGYYGPNVPLDIHLKFKFLGGFEITAADSNMKGLTTLDMELYANKLDGTREMAASITLGDLSFGFSVLITDMLVSAQITEVYDSTVTVNSCTFGHLSALKLKVELNKGFAIARPIINEKLAGMQLEVPSNIAGVFELHNLNLAYYDSYLYAGATPVFLAPKVSEFL